jgi:murein L,D-transpeptidase YcbB/YkuD
VTAKTTIGDVIAVISNNSGDVVEAIDKLGGLGNVLKASPALFRIFKTMSDRHDDPLIALENVEKVLYYSDATKERISAFQKKHGLHADGLVGDRTWSKVEELLKGK